ncbi:MAG: putative porin, partial [Bacteroidia bacterium]|nr:putative porin [Bacteroidia bacterium]
MLFLVFANFQTGFSQNPPDFVTRGAGGSSASNTENQLELEEPYVNYIQLRDISQKVAFEDTTLLGFEIFAKHRQFETAALNLGNYGSSQLPIVYKPTRDIFTDVGFHQYDLYKKDLNSIKYYDINRPFNDLSFSPLAGQDNFEVKATFTRNFANDVNLSIDFDRIKQEGFYPSQETKATSLAVGYWKKNEEKKHNLFISFLANNFNELHSGGIDTMAYDLNGIFTGSIRNPRGSAPTLLSSQGVTRHQHFTYAMDNFWLTKNEKFELHHQVSFEHGFYRYGDEGASTSQDSLVYLNLLTDTRGVRFINKINRLINQLDVSFKSKQFDLSLGINYNLLSYNNSFNTSLKHDLALSAKINYEIGNVSQLQGSAHLGVGQNAGNFQLLGNLNITPIKQIEIDLYTNILRTDPSLIQEEIYITSQLAYKNDFSKFNSLHLGGKLSLQSLGLSFEINSGLLDKPIYLNKNALFDQLDGSTEYFQATIKQRLFWKFIGLENSGVYQTFTDNIYQLPTFYSQHNLYLQSHLFKKRLLAKIGVLFYNTRYDGAINYMPIIGGFYPTDQENEFYPYSELYGVFKV